MSKKENHLSAYKEYFNQKKTVKLDINSLIRKIESTEKSFSDNGNMGLTSEYFTENDVRQKVINKLTGNTEDVSIIVTATSKIVRGKNYIVGVSHNEARALGFVYGINLWDNPDAIQCCISADNNQQCKAMLKITNKVSSYENFIVVSGALAKNLNLKNKDQISISNIKFNIKRTNLDKIDSGDSGFGWKNDY